jgi:CysZ protein
VTASDAARRSRTDPLDAGPAQSNVVPIRRVDVGRTTSMTLPLHDRTRGMATPHVAARGRAVTTRAPGFLRGARYVIGGARFVLGTRSLWGFAFIPAAMTAGILWMMGSAIADWVVSRGEVIAAEEGRSAYVTGWLRREASPAWLTPTIAVCLLVAAIVQPMCALALDIVTREQGWRAARRSWAADAPTEVPFRSFEATMCALAASLPPLALLTLGGFRYPRVAYPLAALALVISGIALAWNFVEYPLSRRDLSFGQRTRWIRKYRGAVLGFGLTCAVLQMVPVIGLLVVPAGIAGAARLVIDCERAGRARKMMSRRAPRGGSTPLA